MCCVSFYWSRTRFNNLEILLKKNVIIYIYIYIHIKSNISLKIMKYIESYANFRV